MSWASAFGKAASIRPNDADLDDEFLRRTTSDLPFNSNEGGLAAVARLAEEASTSASASTSVITHEDGDSELLRDNKRRGDGGGRKRGEKKKRKKRKREKFDSREDHASAAGSSKKRRDRDASPDNGSDDETADTVSSTALEGCSVPHPYRYGEIVLVLIDRRLGLVYSLMGRHGGGKRSVLGKVVNGKVRLDLDALKGEKEGDDAVSDPTVLSADYRDNNCKPLNVVHKETESTKPLFPFPTDPDDHCESPPEAYQDIAPLLSHLPRLIAKDDRKTWRIGKKTPSSSNLAIYDPYYCDGSVVTHLSRLGFCNVRNRKEDCYAVWSSLESYPEFNVLLTNPPYSGDHVQKLVDFVTSVRFGSRPWFLLMPNWVHKKGYYTEAMKKSNCQPFYLIPRKRYVYAPPKNFREKKNSDVHRKSSPFVSMWYIWGGTPEHTDCLVRSFYEHSSACDLARSRSALRDLRRKGKNK